MDYQPVQMNSLRDKYPASQTRKLSQGIEEPSRSGRGGISQEEPNNRGQRREAAPASMNGFISSGRLTTGDSSEEARPFIHKYFFRRPRMLQYYQNGEVIDSTGRRLRHMNTHELRSSRNAQTGGELVDTGDVYGHLVEHNTDASKVQRAWLDLFIDLLWAGIVSNISESFVLTAFTPGSSWGLAFLEFIVLFLTAFRIWNYLRRFLNIFFNKDYLQSIFLTWIFLLALFFGNQAPHFLEPGGKNIIIWTYLTAKFSFILIQIVYCIFIPELRRELLITIILALPVSGLWIGALKVAWPSSAALAIPAIALEGLVSSFMELPVGDYFLNGAPKKALDPDNSIERLQGFFIIILGEGVVTLIMGSSWGSGISVKVFLGVMALLIYYSLFWLYFNGDLSKTYTHALYRNQYTTTAFQTLHILLYASLLLVASSNRYLISNSFSTPETAPVAARASETTLEDQLHSLSLARWTVSAALAATLACITAKALLNRSLDGPRTLFVNNRYMRMAPRAIVIIITMCLPIKTSMGTGVFLSVLAGMLLLTNLWEYVVSLENGCQLVEPRDTV